MRFIEQRRDHLKVQWQAGANARLTEENQRLVVSKSSLLDICSELEDDVEELRAQLLTSQAREDVLRVVIRENCMQMRSVHNRTHHIKFLLCAIEFSVGHHPIQFLCVSSVHHKA